MQGEIVVKIRIRLVTYIYIYTLSFPPSVFLQSSYKKKEQLVEASFVWLIIIKKKRSKCRTWIWEREEGNCKKKQNKIKITEL